MNRPSHIRLEGDCTESDIRYDIFANLTVNRSKSTKLDRFDRDFGLTRSTRSSQRGKKPIPYILNLFLPNTTKKFKFIKYFSSNN